MKAKMILGVALLIGIGLGTYIYQNRYSFFKYLPTTNEEQLKNLNGQLCDESGKPFSGRSKRASDDYMDIYSYKNGELDGLNVTYYKNNIKEIGHWKDGKQNGLFQMYTEDGILIDSGIFKDGERDGLTEQFYNDTGKLRVSANYKNGALEGEYKAYYPNGNIWTKQEFKNNDLNGVYEVYYEDGNPQLKAKIKNGEIIEEQRFNRDGTPYKEEEKITINDTVSFDEITIKEVSDDEIVMLKNTEEFSKEFEKGMEELGKEVGNSLNSMIEATIIANLAYVDLMSLENVQILEENLVFNDDEKVPFKRSHKNGVYAANVSFENNAYLWVELKENNEKKHRLFAESYKKFKKVEKDKKVNLEELIFPMIDDYYRENNILQKYFDITVSVKNHS